LRANNDSLSSHKNLTPSPRRERKDPKKKQLGIAGRKEFGTPKPFDLTALIFGGKPEPQTNFQIDNKKKPQKELGSRGRCWLQS